MSVFIPSSQPSTTPSYRPAPYNEENDSKVVFESMGSTVLLVCIRNTIKHLCPYHWFFKDTQKLPLDVSINPQTKELNYLKYFIDEKINIKQYEISIDYTEESPLFDIEMFSEHKYDINQSLDFRSILNEFDLFVISNNTSSVTAFKIGDGIYLLFDDSKIFAGFLLKNLSESAIEEMRKSNIV